MSGGRGIRTALLVAGALVLSGVAVATAPDNDEIIGAIPTTAAIGAEAVTRQFSATVNSVSLADSLDISYGGGDFRVVNTELPTDGVWVVLDLSITTRYRAELLQYSELVIDGVSYRASNLLPSPVVSESRFGPGIAVRGPFVFEIPRDIARSDAAANAVIVLQAELAPQVEGVTHHPVDLTALDHESTVVLEGARIVGAS